MNSTDQLPSITPAQPVFVADPGHGWRGVAMSDIEQLGIRVTSISVFSYLDSSTYTVWLEEDCDIALYLSAHGSIPMNAIPSVHMERCPIRHMARCDLWLWSALKHQQQHVQMPTVNPSADG